MHSQSLLPVRPPFAPPLGHARHTHCDSLRRALPAASGRRHGSSGPREGLGTDRDRDVRPSDDNRQVRPATDRVARALHVQCVGAIGHPLEHKAAGIEVRTRRTSEREQGHADPTYAAVAQRGLSHAAGDDVSRRPPRCGSRSGRWCIRQRPLHNREEHHDRPAEPGFCASRHIASQPWEVRHRTILLRAAAQGRATGAEREAQDVRLRHHPNRVNRPLPRHAPAGLAAAPRTRRHGSRCRRASPYPRVL